MSFRIVKTRRNSGDASEERLACRGNSETCGGKGNLLKKQELRILWEFEEKGLLPFVTMDASILVKLLIYLVYFIQISKNRW